jgi:hypothetical protein
VGHAGMTMTPAVGVSTRTISAGSCPCIGVHHLFHEIRNTVFHISTILIEGICNLTPKITYKTEKFKNLNNYLKFF